MKNTVSWIASLLFLFSVLLVSAGTAQEPPKSPPQAEANEESKSEKQEAESRTEKEQSAKGDSSADTKPSKKRSQPAMSRTRRRDLTFSKRAPDFVDVFAQVVESVSDSVVTVHSGKKDVAFGAVVDSAGLVLTKASELRGDLTCTLADGKELKARVFGIDPDTDLAMLKIEMDNLTTVDWKQGATPVVGQWLATPGPEGKAISVGVVSVDERKIPPSGGFIGIVGPRFPAQGEAGKGVRINEVSSDTPASRAGLRVNDYIIKIDDHSITDFEKLREVLKQYGPGDRIEITIMRGDKELVLPLSLGDPQRLNPLLNRSNTQNNMGSNLSRRKRDFPLAFQHDSQLQARYCGGPIVDLSGKVVGINIARAGRVSSLALPTSVVLPIIERLKTGDYAPEVVNKEKIAQLDVDIKLLDVSLQEFPEKKQTLEKLIAANDAREEELKRMAKEIQERLESIKKSNEDSQKSLEEIQKEFEQAEANRKRLERERKKLATGIRER